MLKTNELGSDEMPPSAGRQKKIKKHVVENEGLP
jgi:hypothetical protein